MSRMDVAGQEQSGINGRMDVLATISCLQHINVQQGMAWQVHDDWRWSLLEKNSELILPNTDKYACICQPLRLMNNRNEKIGTNQGSFVYHFLHGRQLPCALYKCTRCNIQRRVWVHLSVGWMTCDEHGLFDVVDFCI